MATRARRPDPQSKTEHRGENEAKEDAAAMEALRRAVDAVVGPEASFAEREAVLLELVQRAVRRAMEESGK